MLDDPEMQRAALKQYARFNMPDVHHINPGETVLHPGEVAAKRAADQVVTQATREYNAAQQHLHGVIQSHLMPHPDVVAAERRVAAALKNATRQEAFNQGRHPSLPDLNGDNLPGTDSPFRNQLEQARAQQAAGRHAAVVQAQAERDAIKQQVAERRALERHFAERVVDAKKDALKDAQATRAHLPTPSKLQGLVVHDPTLPRITGGKYKDLGLRHLGDDEIRAHMAANGVDTASYINMTHAKTDSPPPSTLRISGTSDGVMNPSRGAFTGRNVEEGTWTPGRASMLKTLLQGTRAVGYANADHQFLNTFGMRHPEGRYYTPQEAADAQARSGDRLLSVHSPVIGPDAHVLVPKAALEQYRYKMGYNKGRLGTIGEVPGLKQFGKLGQTVNRGFRLTALPWSHNLPLMHMAEGITRTALTSGWHAPMDIALDKKVMANMDPHTVDIVHAQTRHGGIMGMGHRMNEDLHKVQVGDESKLQSRALAPFRAYEKLGQGMLKVQRLPLSPAERASRGAYFRQTAKELGTNDPAKIADAMNDPVRQRDLANWQHRNIGKYANFTAASSKILPSTPFAPWLANAVRLGYDVLPRDHPLLTSAMTNEAHANQKQWDATHAGLPRSLQNAIPLGPGHWLDVSHWGPLPFTTDSPGETLIKLAAPAYSSAALGLIGHDPFYKPMQDLHPHYAGGHKQDAVIPGSGRAVAEALNAFLAGQLGPAQQIARAVEGRGSTLTNASMPLFGQYERKPNSAHNGTGILAGLNKSFNPFAGTYIKGGNVLSSGPQVSGGIPQVSGGGPQVSGGIPQVSGGIPHASILEPRPGTRGADLRQQHRIAGWTNAHAA
jgi:hypothetical protein